MSKYKRFRGYGLVLLALAWMAGGTVWAAEGETTLLAQLVWATDGTKPAGKDLKAVDAVVRSKLRGVFRWKEYYEIGRKEFKVGPAAVSRVRMSPKCEIEVERFGRSTFEVKLFGEGKLVVKQRQSLKPGELLVLAGDDKDDTAWFVVIRMQKP
jgi:hypothetical protein